MPPLRRGAQPPIHRLILAALLLTAPLSGCTTSNRYLLVEQNLQAGNPSLADQVIEKAEEEYGSSSRVLYRMDRGMTLHLAGQYLDSSAVLEQAESEIEDLYTRRLRQETKGFLVNDTLLPYEGEPYEQVMVNVLKALNYAATGNWPEALVEARRIDARLNLLTDTARDKDAYQEDGFARYLTGILYEATGDINNAFIAYRKAYEGYRQAQPWGRVPPPAMLHADLLRTSAALGFTQEHDGYRQTFPDAAWEPAAKLREFAQIVVISYNGRAPSKEDQFIDLPISLDALRLLLLTKSVVRDGNQDARAAESLLYGLSGHVVRVALPRLVAGKTSVAHVQVSLSGDAGVHTARSELAQDFSAMAAKSLNDRYVQVARKAVARAAVKYALAEGAGRGARAVASRSDSNLGPLLGLIIGGLAHALAIGTEEADKRCWRTLPDEIHVTRLWVPAGEYRLQLQPITKSGGSVRDTVHHLVLQGGETRFFTQRVLQ